MQSAELPSRSTHSLPARHPGAAGARGLKDVPPAWTLAKCVRAVPLASHSSAPAKPCASQVALLLGGHIKAHTLQAAADADTTLLLRRSQAAVYISAENLDAVLLAADITDHLKLECDQPGSRLGRQVKQLQVQLREQCAANDARASATWWRHVLLACCCIAPTFLCGSPALTHMLAGNHLSPA